MELTDVHVALPAPHWIPSRHLGAFAILLSSPNDVRVIAARRGGRCGGCWLLFAVFFGRLRITQSLRRVEQRTAQLRHEITERERAEQLRVVKVKRSRIARDLHDDLGKGTMIVSGRIRDGLTAPAAGLNIVVNCDTTTLAVMFSALEGINTYTGETDANRGILRLGATNTLPITTLLNVGSAGSAPATFDLNSFDQTVAA